MRAALYARVSTNEQTVEPQLQALRGYARARGWAVTEYVDDGLSGRKRDRPALEAMLTAARRREIDAVVVVKLDRLGRSLVHLLGILGDLEALSVAFVSLDDGVDTGTAAGRLFTQIRGAFAEYEAALIRERTKAGLEAARRRGARLGRPAALDRGQVVRARRLAKSGRSVREIGRVLGCSPMTALRAVRGKR